MQNKPSIVSIGGGILIILGILDSIFPQHIHIPQIHIDPLAAVLVGVGFVVLFNKILIRGLLWFKNVRPQWIIKGFIVILCLAVIIVRMFYSNLKFDNTSLYLMVIVIVVVIIPDIKDFLLRIRKFKKGDFEIELGETLNQFKEKVEKAEEKIEEHPAPQASYSNDNQQIISQLASAASDPRGMLLVIASEIEQRIRALSISAGVYSGQRHVPSVKLLKSLENGGVISDEITTLFREFWSIRNQIAHGHHYDLSDNHLYEVAELGVKLLSLLPTNVKGEDGTSDVD